MSAAEVLSRHQRWATRTCICGITVAAAGVTVDERNAGFAQHQVDMLREAGLLAETDGQRAYLLTPEALAAHDREVAARAPREAGVTTVWGFRVRTSTGNWSGERYCAFPDEARDAAAAWTERTGQETQVVRRLVGEMVVEP